MKTSGKISLDISSRKKKKKKMVESSNDLVALCYFHWHLENWNQGQLIWWPCACEWITEPGLSALYLAEDEGKLSSPLSL